jgi:type I restriction enzyme, S subunit
MISFHSPQLWPWIAIAEIADLVGGGTPSRENLAYFTGSIPWLTGYDLPGDRISVVTKGREKITPEAIDQSATNLVPEKTILLTTRVTVGKTAVAEVPLCFSQDVTGIVLKFPEIIDPYFVAYFLFSIRDKLLHMHRGTTIQGITRKDVGITKIPIPPISEQKRIVEILQQADALRVQHSEANQCTQQLIPAVFHDMFGDPAINPKKWKVVKIGSLVVSCEYGCSQKPTHDNTGIPIIRMNNVSYQGNVDLHDLKYVRLIKGDLAKYLLVEGDVLFNRTNSRELVGKTGLWDGRIEAVAASYFIRVRFDMELEHPQHFVSFMNLPYMKQRLMNMARGAIGQSNINAQELQSILIPCPPIELQRKFARYMDEVSLFHKRQHHADIQYETLFNSLLSRAFKAELTAVWRKKYETDLQEDATKRDELLTQRKIDIKTEEEIEESITALFNFDETHPRYFLLRDLSDEQRRLYQAAINTQGFFTPQSLVENTGWDLERVQRGLMLLATAGLLARVSVPVNPDGRGIIYRHVYHNLRSDDDAETVRDIDLQTLIRYYPNLQRS